MAFTAEEIQAMQRGYTCISEEHANKIDLLNDLVQPALDACEELMALEAKYDGLHHRAARVAGALRQIEIFALGYEPDARLTSR